MQYLLLDDFKNYRFISDLKLSPDGKNIALLGRKANKDNSYDAVIFVDKGCGFKPLTNLAGSVSHFLWLNNENVLFSEIRDKTHKEKIEKGYELTCFYKINIYGGEAELAFKVDAVVTKLELLNCGKFIATTVFDNARPSFAGKCEAEAEELLKEIKKAKEYKIIDELPFWFDGDGFTNKKRNCLSILTPPQKGEFRALFLTPATIKDLKPLTHNLTNVAEYRLSDCQKYLAYTGVQAPAEIYTPLSNIHIVNLETFEETLALKEPKQVRSFAFWKDKLIVSFTEPEQKLHEHGPFYIVGPKTKNITELAKHDYSIGDPGMSDSKFGGGIVSKVIGDSYFFTSLKGYHTDIYELNLNTGEIRNITNSKGSIDFFDMEGGRIVAGFMPSGKLLEVFELKSGKLEKLSEFNDEIHNTRKYSAPEHFTFRDIEGAEIDGWVIKPVDYEEGKNYPAILEIHGGPKAAYCENYFHEMQLFANRNYFVMFSNPRGSDGKGSEFADVRGKYGGIDYENLMQFLDECLSRYPGIDSDKMAVMGGSYGGFMTNWIVSRNNRFKAAVTMRSVCNWVTDSFISDIGCFYVNDQMDICDPWDEVEKLWHHSPLKYAKDVKTPTLVLHSDEDYRCCTAEAYQWYTALKLLGVDTRLIIFHGENHALSRSGKPDLREKRLIEIINWVDNYLLL